MRCHLTRSLIPLLLIAFFFSAVDSAFGGTWSDRFAPYGFDRPATFAIEYNGDLYVGGEFSYNGHDYTGNVARWDGNGFVSTGVIYPLHATLSAVVYQGYLYVSRIAAFIDRYDGNTWESVADLDSGFLDYAFLTVYDSKLVVAGTFYFIDVAPEVTGSVLAFDGTTWAPLDTLDFVGAQIDLLEYDGDLYLAGDIQQGVQHPGIMRFDGSTWQPVSGYGNVGLSTGVQFTYPGGAQVVALAEYDGKLVIAGDLVQVGDVPVNGIGTFNAADSTWGTLGDGFDNDVHSVGIYNGDLVASGNFLMSGATPVRRFARWGGSSWTALGGGGDGWANGLYQYGTDLLALGGFNELDGGRAARVGSWDGASWSPMVGSDPGLGVEGDVNEMIPYDDRLVVLGDIPAVGSQLADNMIAWDGNQWSEFAGGANGPITAACVNGNTLFVGGDFTQIGGVPANGVARWNGSSWLGYGNYPYTPAAMAVYNGSLYVGSSDLRRWSGLWNFVPSNPVSSQVLAMQSYGGNLVVGGPGYLSRWTGSGWNDISTLPNSYQALFEFDGTLYVGTTGKIFTWDGATFAESVPTAPTGGARDFCEHNGYLVVTSGYYMYRAMPGDPSWESLGPYVVGVDQPKIASYGGHIMVGDHIYHTQYGPSLGIAQLDETVSSIGPPSASDSYRLEQNVPNPFNPTTTIGFELGSPGHVRLEVFDVAGRHVATLVDGFRGAGHHTVTLDLETAGIAASGVYFYRLVAPGFSQTRKMVLLK